MKELNIVDDFDQINISSHRHINKLIEDITARGLNNENEILLNLKGCQTDYPETPRLIDFFLEHLEKLNGDKVLTVEFDGLGTKEIYILYDMILEGKFFDINEKIEDPKELGKWKDNMNSKLLKCNILLTINYTPSGESYVYGNAN